MKYLVYIFCFAFIFSCNSKEKNENIEENVAGKKVYDMYQPSEMATLMNEMYAENLKIKNEILAGNTPEVFPTDFLKIHTAQLSDFKKRNAKFEAFSKLYIVAEQDVLIQNLQCQLKIVLITQLVFVFLVTKQNVQDQYQELRNY